MTQYINKADVVAEIERLREEEYPCDTFEESTGYYNALDEVSSFLNTLEVKEIHEDIDVDLNPIFEEFEIDPDSRFASMFKEGFYKGIDRYLNKKENKL